MISAFFPGIFTRLVPGLFGLQMTDVGVNVWQLSVYIWISLCMLGAWLAKVLDAAGAPQWLLALYVYLIGYGPILCAITFDAYIKEARGAAMVWDKTEKTGRVLG